MFVKQYVTIISSVSSSYFPLVLLKPFYNGHMVLQTSPD